MNMKSEQDNFENVRRLLVLKRHETPPPGYFDSFSRQVIARIQAGERAAEPSFFEQVGLSFSWVQKLWGAFETKPILSGALGVSVCGLLMAGIVYSEQVEPGQASFATVQAQPGVALTASQPSGSLFKQPATFGFENTGVVVAPGDRGAAILGEIQGTQAQPVSFSLRGSN
jgi:hypothetical protein